MSKVRIFDMLSDQTTSPIENQRQLRTGKVYAIADVASLPADFVADFASKTASASAATSCAQKEMQDSIYTAFQLFIPAKGAGFASLAVKIQQSNIGGTAAGVWVDVPGATATLTDVGNAWIYPMIDGTTKTGAGLKLAKMYRVVLGQAVGGTCTVYVIGYGLAEV